MTSLRPTTLHFSDHDVRSSHDGTSIADVKQCEEVSCLQDSDLGHAILGLMETKCWNGRNKMLDEECVDFRLLPLVSRHNAIAIGRLLMRSMKKIVNRKKCDVNSKSCFLADENQRSWKDTLFLLFVRLLPCASLILSCASIFVIGFVVKWLCFVSLCFLMVVVDWNDATNVVRGYFPSFCKNIGSWFTEILRIIDNRLLMGRRFVGREWNKNDYEWDVHNNEYAFTWWQKHSPHPVSSSCCVSSKLRDFPPPAISDSFQSCSSHNQKGKGKNNIYQCLDINYLKSVWKDWSSDTVSHAASVNFCYIMLMEEEDSKARIMPPREKSSTQSVKIRRKNKNKSVNRSNSELIESPSGTRKKRHYMESFSLEEIENITYEENMSIINEIPINSDTVAAISENHLFQVTPLQKGADKFQSLMSPRESIELKMIENNEDSPSSSDEEQDSVVNGLNTSMEMVFSDDTYLSGKDEFDVKSMSTIYSDSDLPWLDVGVKVGKLLLNSAPLQRAMASQETTDRFRGIGVKFGSAAESFELQSTTSNGMIEVSKLEERQKNLLHNGVGKMAKNSVRRIAKPVHPLWTSSTSAASVLSPGSYSLDNDDCVCFTDPLSPANERLASQSNELPLLPIFSKQKLEKNEAHQKSDVSSSMTKIAADQNVSIDDGDRASEVSSVEVSLMEQFHHAHSWEVPAQSLDSKSILIETIPISDSLSRTFSISPRKQTYSVKSPRYNSNRRQNRRMPLKSGVKVAIPLFPFHPLKKIRYDRCSHVMASVISSERIYVDDGSGCQGLQTGNNTNCLSVTAKMEKFYLRNGEFAELTFRVMDDWDRRYMPRHSKVPIGSCVATKFGIGVLVGWRVEDDCHVVRSLWQRRGAGTANAYLNRQAIFETIEAATGFHVKTNFGEGDVVSCSNFFPSYKNCRFSVSITDDGRNKGNVLQINRQDILSCFGAQFIPVTEHLREAVKYQLQVDSYYAALREQRLNEPDPPVEHEFRLKWTLWVDIMWSSFLVAAKEDKDFDSSVKDIMDSVLMFLENLDKPAVDDQCTTIAPQIVDVKEDVEAKQESAAPEPGFWIMNDLFGGIFSGKDSKNKTQVAATQEKEASEEQKKPKPVTSKFYDRAFGVLRILMKTFSVARASSVDHPHLRMALAIGYDFLLFIRTVIKVQQQNASTQSADVWKRSWSEIVATFGPLKERFERIVQGIVQRMQTQGRKAKIRVLKFSDKILNDERLLVALEQGDWDRCLARLEIALVEANVIEGENLVHYRKAAKFIYSHVHVLLANEGKAASRNSEKLAILAQFVKLLASPRRSLLKFIGCDEVLDLFERILVRAYHKKEVATRMLTLHAANFHTLRHLRMLKYFPISGRIWVPLLDAADEEFSWLISQLPESSKEFLDPLASLFSLGVIQFHRINAGDLSKDWLAFLLDDDASAVVQDLDMKVLVALESFSRDIREMMIMLPYYSSIDVDILNLMDEVDLDEFLKEASDAFDDPDLLSQFIREKATIAVERFLNYLPKLSIPVEKRELSDDWVLTCRGEDGGDLTLSGVNIKRENLVCQLMGGDTLFFPMFTDDDMESRTGLSSSQDYGAGFVEESVLDQIRELILSAQSHGCWKPGFGGVDKPSSDHHIFTALEGLPLSSVLNCALELWRDLELDDDELLEIAIRDVSYQIQLEKEREEGIAPSIPIDHVESQSSWGDGISSASSFGSNASKLRISKSFDSGRRRFNPRIDATVLYLEIKNLKLNLLHFQFRIEKNEKKTVFDPVFEGKGAVSLENISIRLRIDCAKQIHYEESTKTEVASPVLRLRELDVALEKLRMKVKDTGFGSDWLLNKAVDVFEENITKVVEENLKEQINAQVGMAIDNLNSYFSVNPNVLLNLLSISMDDLEENLLGRF